MNPKNESGSEDVMEGTSSVLFTRPGSEEALRSAVERYMQALVAESALAYVDLHSTKHAHKLVMIEMYRDAAGRERQSQSEHGKTWASAKNELLESESAVERIRPVWSLAPHCARPVDPTVPAPPGPLECIIGSDAEPFGAFVRIFPRVETEADFFPLLERQGRIVAEHEPGYLFADFYRFDTPGCMMVVEYYDDRRSLSHHHTLPHTFEFARIKAEADYESAKHQAFTLRPMLSLGPWGRLFKPDASLRVQAG